MTVDEALEIVESALLEYAPIDRIIVDVTAQDGAVILKTKGVEEQKWVITISEIK